MNNTYKILKSSQQNSQKYVAKFSNHAAKVQLFFELTKYFADFSAVFGVFLRKTAEMVQFL